MGAEPLTSVLWGLCGMSQVIQVEQVDPPRQTAFIYKLND